MNSVDSAANICVTILLQTASALSRSGDKHLLYDSNIIMVMDKMILTKISGVGLIILLYLFTYNTLPQVGYLQYLAILRVSHIILL